MPGADTCPVADAREWLLVFDAGTSVVVGVLLVCCVLCVVRCVFVVLCVVLCDVCCVLLLLWLLLWLLLLHMHCCCDEDKSNGYT